MGPRSTSIRLIGGPRVLDGTVWPVDGDDPNAEAPFVIAVRGSRVCPLADLIDQCVDRASTNELAAAWRVATYAVSGRTRRVRPRIYRYEDTFVLDAHRTERGGWSLRPGRRWAASVADGSIVADALIWSKLEAGVDRAGARFRVVADLVPDGPLGERARGAASAVDACVADAARLCAVGATVVPDWEPGQADDEGTALVVRISALVGTIDEATRELVHLHLELGDDVRPAETLALLGEAVAELSPPDYQRGDQDDDRNNRDSH
jgi:hypothetical protein